MDFNYILENGYKKLLPYISDMDKEYLKGYECAIDQLKVFKDNIDDFIGDEIDEIAKIKIKMAEYIIDKLIEWCEDAESEIKVSLIDSLEGYMLDENKNVVADDGYRLDENGKAYKIENQN